MIVNRVSASASWSTAQDDLPGCLYTRTHGPSNATASGGGLPLHTDT